MEQPVLSAPQSTADIILIPCAIGWGFQLILFGLSTPTACALLRKKDVQKLAKYLLGAAFLCNVVYTGIVFTDVIVYMKDQDRSEEALLGYIEVDAISPLVEGLAAAFTQTYLAIRCFYISDKSWLTVAPIAIVGIVGFGASFWTTVWSFGYLHGTKDGTAIWIPTVLLLLAQFVADLLITGLTSYQLVKMRKGVQSETDQLLAGLYRLAFQTGFAPMAATLTAAIMYMTTYNTDLLWNLYSVIFAILPSLYVISFVHCFREQYRRKEEHQSNSSSGGHNGSSARRVTQGASYQSPAFGGRMKSFVQSHQVPVVVTSSKDLELELDDLHPEKVDSRV